MFEFDYIQAKLHGIHSKSVVGDNYTKLKKIKSIEKLRKELFPDDNTPLQGKALYSYLEKKFKLKTFKEINYISKFFNFKNKIVNNMILKYEVDNVKLIVNGYYAKEKSIKDLFEVELVDTLDYEKVYQADISDYNALKQIFSNTVFDFLIPVLKEKKDVFEVENRIDMFYYEHLLDSLKSLSGYEAEKLEKIIVEEMNWQNIAWAFRTKMFYKKSFANIKDTFLKNPKLISPGTLEKIYELQFIPDEARVLFRGFPKKYLEIILASFNEDGDFDIILLEENIMKHMMDLYTKYFFIEYFNILPIISFIFIKKNEYKNVVKLIESIRYNI